MNPASESHATGIPPEDFLAGGGEMGALVRTLDWSGTALGSIAKWPSSLRNAVSSCLRAKLPVAVVWGAEMIVIYNDAFRSIFGAKHPTSVGARARDVWAERWKVVGPILEDVLSKGIAVVSEHERLRVEGSQGSEERYFTFSYDPIRDESGRVGGVSCVATDTTDQLVWDRRYRTLVESTDYVAAAILAKDEFLTVASHELRTPLTTLGLQIDGLVRALRRSNIEDSESRKWLARAEKIRTEADRIEALVESMLDVFGLRREPVPPRLEEIDLAALTRAVVDRLAPASKKANVTIEVTGTSVVGSWDRHRLEQILSQLLSNAMKFGAGDVVQIVIERIGERARLSVIDRGVGIAPEDHERIFDRFERASSSNHYGGFGLGLWMVRELVRSMQGTVRVESFRGRGSTFIVELPRST